MEGREVALAKEGLCFKMEEFLTEGVVEREAGRDGRPAHKKRKGCPAPPRSTNNNQNIPLKSSDIVKVIRKLSS